MSPTPNADPQAPLAEPALQLDWSAYDAYGQGDAYAAVPQAGGGFGKAAAVCIGSRSCQRADAKTVMCPSFRITGDVQHSTQHRAATLRAAMNGELGPQPFEHPDLAAAMALCVACKGCKRDCPNGVDMALLRTEVLAQRQGGKPLPWREHLVATLPRWLPWLRRAGPLRHLHQPGNWLARGLQRWLGLAAQRSLPQPAPQAFLDRPAEPVPPTPPAARDVVLLIDTFSNQLDPDTAAAAVQVLQAAGCHVHVLRPPEGEAALCCGRSAWSVGALDRAQHEASRLLRALQPFVARGLPIIGLEPSCLLMLRDEYLSLKWPEPDPSDPNAPDWRALAQATAKRALLLEEFLARDSSAQALGLQPLPQQVLVHGHCHQKAFGTLKAMRKVLGWVPELQVEFIESSCCGMAGAFGYEAEHHGASMQMAEAALLPAVRAAAPSTWLVANGTSCRHQILDGSQREARHFVHVLQAALAKP